MTRGQGYGQVCSMALAADVVAERWTFLVLREVLLGSRRFNDIHRGIPRISPTMLARRLDDLCRHGLVERSPSREYAVTASGKALKPILFALADWGRRHARYRLELERVDPAVLLWEVRRWTNVRALPARRALIAFRLEDTAASARSWWFVAERRQIELCLRHPGYEVDLTVTTTVRALAQVWLGELDVNRAIRTGALRLEGDRELIRTFPRWIGVSPAARPNEPRASGPSRPKLLRARRPAPRGRPSPAEA